MADLEFRKIADGFWEITGRGKIELTREGVFFKTGWFLQVPMSIGKKKAPLHTAHSETAAEKGGIVETSISDRVAWRYLHLRLDRA